MNEEWFEELKAQVENFLDKATDEELYSALRKAGYDYYKNVDYAVIRFHEERDTRFIPNKQPSATLEGNEAIFEEIALDHASSSFADDYQYCIAA